MRRVLLSTCLLIGLPCFADPSVSLARFDDAAVMQAVHEAAAESSAPRSQPTADFSNGDQQTRRIELAFKEAEVPDCLHAEGLKRQPPVILFIPVSGYLALPFVGIAKLRGKCK